MGQPSPSGQPAWLILGLLIAIGAIVGACLYGWKAKQQSSLTAPLVRGDDGSAVCAEGGPSMLVAAAVPLRASVGRTVASVLDATGLVDFADALAEAGCVDADDIKGMPDAELAELGMKPVQIRRLHRVLGQ